MVNGRKQVYANLDRVHFSEMQEALDRANFSDIQGQLSQPISCTMDSATYHFDKDEEDQA